MSEGSPDLMNEVPPVPARILNEHVYCPRLAYLEWPAQGFRHNADTVEGQFVHRNVEKARGKLPSPDELEEAGEDAPPTTSIQLSSEELGLTAKLDVVEVEGGRVRPFEYKRGRPRSAERPLWDPELVQLSAQAMLLREAGYRVEEMEVYFNATRTRHRVPLTEALVERVQDELTSLRRNAVSPNAPPPLTDSPKCPRCSLIGICLPDEVNYLSKRGEIPARRRLIATDPPATPLYAITQGSRLTKRGGRLVLIENGEEVQSRRLVDVSHIALFGNVDVGSALVREMLDRGVPIIWLTYGGWLSGVATGMPPGNVELRMRQHRAGMVNDAGFARAFVDGKIRNQRTLLRRHGDRSFAAGLAQLTALTKQVRTCPESDSLLGLEGTASRIYFDHFRRLLRPPGDNDLGSFDFRSRSRRPPTDRVNALLSFLYSMLIKDVIVATLASGLDPYVGLYHRPKFGRPALALDLAEEFRALICDSTALMLINNGEIRPGDFIERGGAFSLTKRGRKQTISAYERRMKTELKHPLFGYQASYRRALEIQARLLAAALLGDTPRYRSLTTR